MSNIIKSTVIILAIGTIAAYGTYSFFSDTEKSSGNMFTAGSIDLKIDSQCSYDGQSSNQCGVWQLKDLVPTADKFFNFSSIEPGDFGENTVSLHIDNNDAWACMTIKNLQNNENDCNDAEKEAGDITCGSAPDQGELAQELYFTAWDDTNGNNVWNSGEQLLFSNKFGPASDILNGKTYTLADSTTGVPISGGQTKNIGIKWCFGEMTVDESTHTISCDGSKVGNKAQTDSLLADVKFYVEQSKNNEHFVCSGIDGGNGDPTCVPRAEVCGDQIDNDCDGKVDCGDSDCANDSVCQAPSDGHAVMKLENKDGNWNAITGDNIYGNLTYNEAGTTFDWQLDVQGLKHGENYKLVYVPDPWPQSLSTGQKTAITSFTTDGSGNFAGNGSADLNYDIPNPVDTNYPGYGKVWVVLASDHNDYKFLSWHQSDYLFDTESVFYDDTDVSSNKTITLNDLGASSQYGYYHSYAGANVQFAYDTPASDKLSGTITANGLKPYETYQLKFEGKPTCKFGANGDDTANEYIGYKGRWWDNTTNSNATDANYVANHATHCITGYLVWGYVTADAGGNVTKAVQTDSSYHVLWCSGGTCGQSNNSLLTTGIDLAHPTLNLCQAGNVNGQIERGSCGSLTFNSGEYRLGMILNEESFHQGPGTWTAVMNGDIDFKIN